MYLKITSTNQGHKTNPDNNTGECHAAQKKKAVSICSFHHPASRLVPASFVSWQQSQQRSVLCRSTTTTRLRVYLSLRYEYKYWPVRVPASVYSTSMLYKYVTSVPVYTRTRPYSVLSTGIPVVRVPYS